MSKKPVVLMVLDGYGITDKTEGNAIYMANTPVMDKLMAECPYVRGSVADKSIVVITANGITFFIFFFPIHVPLFPQTLD